MSIFDQATSQEVPIEQEDIVTEEGTAEVDVDVEEDSPEGEQPEEIDETEEDEDQESDDEEEEEQPVDYAKLYKDLQRDYTKKAQELAQIKKGDIGKQDEQVTETVDPQDKFWDMFQQDPMGTLDAYYQYRSQQDLAPILQERQTAALHSNVAAVAKEYPEVATQEGIKILFDTVSQIATEEYARPELINNPTQRLLRMAAAEAFGAKTAKIYAEAKQKGKQEALDSIKQKQGLSAQTGKKQQDQPKSLEDQLADSIVNAGRKGGIFG